MVIGLKDWGYGGCGCLVAQYPPNPPGLPEALPRTAIWVLTYTVSPRIEESLCPTDELIVPSGVWELVGTTVCIKTFCLMTVVVDQRRFSNS